MLSLRGGTEPKVELESEKWKPLILRKCTEDMPPYYAPCLTRVIPALEYGEEVVYPDFEAALPGFFSREDAVLWVDTNYGPEEQGQTASNKRVIFDSRQGRLIFTGVRGQNLAFKDVEFDEDSLPNTWMGDSSHCLGHMTSTAVWRHSLPNASESAASWTLPVEVAAAVGRNASAETPEKLWVDEAAVYMTPDSERYQHFLDHTTKPLMQSAHLITNNTLILPGNGLVDKQDIVRTMWSWLPYIRREQIKHYRGKVMARRLFTSCRVPYVHPYLFFRLQEMVLGPESPRVPLSERKVVIWYTRTVKDSSRTNRGREIRNEEAVKRAIVKLLKDRGLGERLEVHPPANPPADPLEYLRYLNRHVAAMIGPHGGGLCNFKWLARDTLVLELMPRKWISTPLYEEAIGHGLNYWVDIRDSLSDVHDMEASIPNIIGLLKAELGRAPKRGPIIRYRYDWPEAVEDAVGGSSRDIPYFGSLHGKCCNKAEGDQGHEGVYVLPHKFKMAAQAALSSGV